MYIQRKLIEEILPWLGTQKIITIKGARRVGKTEIMHHLEQHLKERDENTLFLSVEHKRHLAIFTDPKLFIRFLKEQYGFSSSKKLYVFLDEFQYIRQSGLFLKEVHELAGDHIQLIIAASTTFKVTKNVEDIANLRKVFYVRRLSFSEYLTLRSELSYQQKFSLSDEKYLHEFYQIYQHDLENYIGEFINWGGYPEVVQERDSQKKEEILGDIIHHYIEKDISSFLRIESVEAYIQLMDILSHEIGNLLNQQDLSVRLDIHKKTLKKYLEIVSGTFTFSFIPPYFTDTGKELAKMNKVYAQDMGIVSYFLPQTARESLSLSPHIGRIKNFIFTELRKLNYNDNIFFYRTIAKAEIDFIICKERELIPIKVKFGKKKQKVPVVMKNFMKTYKDTVKKGIVITQDELRFEENCIFVPFSLFPFLDI